MNIPLASHYQATTERVKREPLVFALQDTTFLDYQTPPPELFLSNERDRIPKGEVRIKAFFGFLPLTFYILQSFLERGGAFS